MTDTSGLLRRSASTIAYGLLGLGGTLAVALVLLRFTVPFQELVYGAFYLQLGPSEATETAVLSQFLGVAVVAIALPLFVGDYLSSRLANRDVLLVVLAGLVGVVVVFLVLALAGLAATPVALLLLGLELVALPLLLRYRFGVRSGAVPAFVGGIPVLVLLLLLVGVGLGWGWGYVVTAQEVPESTVDDAAVETLSDAPAVEAALFAPGNCETDAEGLRRCYLSLRGFEHERNAVRLLSDLGVRCPYRTDSRDGGSALVRHDGRYYEVRCSPHGD